MNPNDTTPSKRGPKFKFGPRTKVHIRIPSDLAAEVITKAAAQRKGINELYSEALAKGLPLVGPAQLELPGTSPEDTGQSPTIL